MKKIIGLLVCMLMIATAIPAVGTMNIDKTEARNEIKYANNLPDDVSLDISDTTDLPEGFEIKIYGTEEIEIIEDKLGVPPEHQAPPGFVMVSFDNRNGLNTIDIEYELSAKGGLLLMIMNKMSGNISKWTFTLNPGEGGNSGGVFVGIPLLKKEAKGFGFVKINVAGKCNNEEFSQSAIGLILGQKLILLVGGSKDTSV